MNRRSFFAMLPGSLALPFVKPEAKPIVITLRPPDPRLTAAAVIRRLESPEYQELWAKRITEIVAKGMERKS